MKRFFSILLILLLTVIFIIGFAENSKSNDDITYVEDAPITIIEDDEDTKELIEQLKTDYILIIHYVYLKDGSPAFPDYSAILTAGTPYTVISPTLINYDVSIKEISNIMPKRNVEYTVFYSTQIFYININNYQVPLGLGNLVMNQGVNFE